MKRCGTCRHWKPDNDKYVNAGQCEAIQHGVRGPRADPEKVVLEVRGETEWGSDLYEVPVPAVAVDGSDYRAAVVCRSDFGCVLHEEKPEGPQ